MNSDHAVNERVSSPAYILPGDPPDIKPDPDDLETLVAVKKEISSTEAACSDEAPDNGPTQMIIEPDLDMLLDVNEDVTNADAASSSDAGVAMLRCNFCNYECLGKDHLDRHVKRCRSSLSLSSTQTGEQPHVCGVCGRGFAQVTSLQRHKRVHNGGRNGEKWDCDQCGAKFTFLCHYKVHMKCHNGVKEHGCEVCSARFVRRHELIEHMRTHTGERPYCCSICQARFVTRQHLTKHTRTHTGERPHCCSFCQARFSGISDMKQHVTILHTHDFKHWCERCGRGFVKPSLVKKHIKKCVGSS